jgi:hypothetical protein
LLALAAALLVIVIGEFTLYAANLRAANDAEGLLRDVANLQVGQSTQGDVEAIVRQYGGNAAGPSEQPSCERYDQRRAVTVTSEISDWIGWRAPILRPFGDQRWRVDAYFATYHDRLCYARYWLRAEPRDESHALNVAVTLSENTPLEGQGAYDASFRDIHNVHDMQTIAMAGATTEERHRAFGLDLSCLTRIGGCREVCEVMPSAWLDYQRKARASGWVVRPDEANDPRCKQLPTYP